MKARPRPARTVTAGEFKNSCLKLMEEVHSHGFSITVTKRGKPIVKVIPYREELPGKSLLGTIVHEARDLFSTGESWEASE